MLFDLSQSIRICNLGPFTLKAHWSTLVLLVFGFMVGPQFASMADLSLVGSIIFSVLTTVALMVSIVIHELGHAYAGRWFANCRRSTITTFALGALCSNSMTEYTSEKRKMLVFAAGPFANFLLAGLGTLVLLLLMNIDYALIMQAGRYTFTGALLVMVMAINLMLGVFNILPIFPLDGGQILYNALQLTSLSYKKIRYITFAVTIATAVTAIFYFGIFDLFGLFIMGIIIHQAYTHLISTHKEF